MAESESSKQNIRREYKFNIVTANPDVVVNRLLSDTYYSKLNNYISKTEAKKPVRSFEVARGFVAILILCIVVGLLVNALSHKDKDKTPTTADALGNTQTFNAFMDVDAFSVIANRADDLTTLCNTNNPVITAKMHFYLTGQQTQDAWDTFVEYLLNQTVNPNQGCRFYGLEQAAYRSNSTIGPVDFCHGYMHMIVQIWIVYYNSILPGDLVPLLQQFLDKAYPLNIFFASQSGSRDMMVAAIFEQLVLAQPITNTTNNITLDIRQMATAVCNPKFYPDNLNYYQSQVQPWLSFPWYGVSERTGHNWISASAANTLQIPLLEDVPSINKIYIVGDVLETTEGAELLLKAIAGKVPIDYDSQVLTISQRIAEIKNQLEPVGSVKTPVMLLARMTQSIDSLLTASFNQINVFIVLTDTDPEHILDVNVNGFIYKYGVDTIMQLFANRLDHYTMTDFTTNFVYEYNLGPDWIPEQNIAEIIMSAAGVVSPLMPHKTYNLADTWALGNTIAAGVDLSKKIQRYQLILQNIADGRSLGFRQFSGSQVLQRPYRNTPEHFNGKIMDIPSTYDFRIHKKQCTPTVLENQGLCQSSWAMSVCYMMQARFCSYGLTNHWGQISCQHIISCAGNEIDGCLPNDPAQALQFFTDGVVDEICYPYENSIVSTEIACAKACKGLGIIYTQFTGRDSPILEILQGRKTIQNEIFKNGPIVGGFTIPGGFTDFYSNINNKEKVFTMADIDFTKPNEGNQDVTIWGWGENYWILQMYWGETWGDHSYFYVSFDIETPYPFWFERTTWVGYPQRMHRQSADDPIPGDVVIEQVADKIGGLNSK